MSTHQSHTEARTTPANVEHAVGNLFTHPGIDALAQGVNCQGAMGAGIATKFREMDEDMYQDYRDLCSRSGLPLGGLHTWRMADGRWIYNLASQFNLGKDARYPAIAASLTLALEHAVEHDVTSIGLPRIGCGIGGLDWVGVRQVIEDVAERFATVRVVTVTPADQV